jgi:hypothetical protein
MIERLPAQASARFVFNQKTYLPEPSRAGEHSSAIEMIDEVVL